MPIIFGRAIASFGHGPMAPSYGTADKLARLVVTVTMLCLVMSITPFKNVMAQRTVQKKVQTQALQPPSLGSPSRFTMTFDDIKTSTLLDRQYQNQGIFLSGGYVQDMIYTRISPHSGRNVAIGEGKRGVGVSPTDHSKNCTTVSGYVSSDSEVTLTIYDDMHNSIGSITKPSRKPGESVKSSVLLEISAPKIDHATFACTSPYGYFALDDVSVGWSKPPSKLPAVSLSLDSATIVASSVKYVYHTVGNPGPSTVGLYQSAKTTFDSSATLIATQTVTPAQNSSGSNSFGLTFTPRPQFPHLLVVVDPFRATPLHDGSNHVANAVRDLAWGAKVTPQFRSKVVTIATEIGTDPNYLMAAMAFESGRTFSPSVLNAAGSGAVGLIQFIPSTATALGTTTQALAKMTAEQQLDYVAAYFLSYRGRLKSLADVYMAILYPAAIGKGNGFVLFDKANDTKKYHPYAQNIGLDSNKDGKITVAEATNIVNDQLQVGLKSQNIFIMQSYYD